MVDSRLIPWEESAALADNHNRAAYPDGKKGPLDKTPNGAVAKQKVVFPASSAKFSGEALLNVRNVVENIYAEVLGKIPYTIGITATRGGEGTSTLAALISFLSAEAIVNNKKFASGPLLASPKAPELGIMDKYKVLLIDTRFENPSIHTIFEQQPENGLGEWLLDSVPLNGLIKSIPDSFLHIITNGGISIEKMSSLLKGKFPSLLTAVKTHYDLIFLDLPPLLTSQQAVYMSGLCDGIVLVLQAGNTPWKDFEKAKALLAASNVDILGTVLNERNLLPKRISKWF